jgi:hypothetical protein
MMLINRLSDSLGATGVGAAEETSETTVSSTPLEQQQQPAIAPWLPRKVRSEVRLYVLRGVLEFMGREDILKRGCAAAVGMNQFERLEAMAMLHHHCRVINVGVLEANKIRYDLQSAFASACHAACASVVAAVLGQQHEALLAEGGGSNPAAAAAAVSAAQLDELLLGLLGLLRDIKALAEKLVGGGAANRRIADNRSRDVSITFEELWAAVTDGLSRVLRPHAVLCAAMVNNVMNRPRRTSEDLTNLIEFIGAISQCMDDRDAFVLLIMRDTECRLLNSAHADVFSEGSGASDVVEEERGLASAMQRCFTGCFIELQRFRKMLGDVEVSQALSTEHRVTVEREEKAAAKKRGRAGSSSTTAAPDDTATSPTITVSLRILSSHVWHVQALDMFLLVLPPALEYRRVVAERVFAARFQKRKLRWNWLRSSVAIRTLYTKMLRRGGGVSGSVSYELLLPMTVAALLLFMDAKECDEVTLAEAEQITDVKQSQVRMTLARLERLKFITFLQQTEDSTDGTGEEGTSSSLSSPSSIGGGAFIKLNRGFAAQSKKFNLLSNIKTSSFSSAAPTTGSTAAAAATSRVADDDVIAAVIADRHKWAVQAAIVRKMKSEKILDFNGICEGVIQLLHNNFVPTVGEIKSAVEQLLDKDYLERDESNRNKFIYKAVS